MEAHWIWWLAALALVVAEMASGTFYLIAVAFGLTIAGLGAYLGMSWSGQAAVAATLCSSSVAGIYLWNKRHASPHKQANFSNDIGQSVRIVSWIDERYARVSYRGAEWDAKLSANATFDAARQTWRIVEIDGNSLVIG